VGHSLAEGVPKVENASASYNAISEVLDVRSFRAADCDTDRYLVGAKLEERLAANKRRSQRFRMGRLSQEEERYRTEV
jgi:hypothetical protein